MIRVLVIIATAILFSCEPVDESQYRAQSVELFHKDIANTFKYYGRIKRGDTIESILRQHDIDNPTRHEIITQLKKVYDVRYLKPNETYTIEIDSVDHFVSFVYQPDVEHEYIVARNDSGVLYASSQTIDLECSIESIKGTIQTNLYDAILAKKETPELLIAFSDIFQWDIDFFVDPRVGDEFKIIVEKYYNGSPDFFAPKSTSKFVKYGKILAASYRLQGKELTAIYFHNSPRSPGYYTPTGESFQKTFLKSPLNYRRISSHFSKARKHPILKIVRPHYGIDFAAPQGTPVSSAADGVIIKKAYEKGIGNYIKIQHNNPRFVTLYGHLSRFARGMAVGVRVKQKQVIGYVGKTGLATGPHLHYTFYDNGKPIDPLKIKNTSGDPILPVNREEFQRVSASMMDFLQALDYQDLPVVLIPSHRIYFNDNSAIKP